ncbi:hypothetical protein SG34_021180 [Thalassomonas viridans]|uniref:Uncharacterized protein n=1 Tax=Thalassomonas viridans TaxID=137584 RepID=A0AAE9YZJ0_9GAMM|nr:hypothetical protein [Thalassomonas viridans]WDE03865.1 hypothetical protein SG34_021180 [Thalassomonas viridans]
MTGQLQLTYNEIDFLIPSYRFNIRFSYTTKRGLPFIREFVLRLVHVSPMKPEEIAEYLGLTQREAKEALKDLVGRGELSYNDLGQVLLTNKANQYFTELGGAPRITDVISTGTILGFEMTAFNCVSSFHKPLNDKWVCGLNIDAKSEVLSDRNKLAKKAFQQQFDHLLERELINKLKEGEDSGRPGIYKIDSIREIKQEPLRIKLSFAMDDNGFAIERDDFDILEDSANAHEAITEALHNNTGQNNYKETVLAIEHLGDPYTGALINERGLNVSKLIEFSESNDQENSNFIPIIGPIYSQKNWIKFTEQFEQVKEKLSREHQDGIKQLKWLGPSVELWGKNNRLINCFDSLLSNRKTKGKHTKTLYAPTLYVPLASMSDRYNKHRWKNDFSGQRLKSVKAYLEGFCDGSVEVLLLESGIVAVTYYLTLPDIYPAPVAIGFISTDNALIERISHSLNDYLTGFYDSENRRDFGSITDL